MKRIIELDEADASRLLWQVQNWATSNEIYNDYWAGIAVQIEQCLEAQKNGEFFQCAACTDIIPE